MGDSFFLTTFLKLLFLITAPVTFLAGIFLIYDLETYLRIEKFFAKSYFLSKKTFISQLEKNRESLQLFLLRKRRFIGIFCLLNSIMAIFVVAFLLKTP